MGASAFKDRFTSKRQIYSSVTGQHYLKHGIYAGGENESIGNGERWR